MLIPTAPKSFRLVKEGDAEAVYDVCRNAEGLVTCNCPSYEKTYRGLGLATCKHGQALVAVGLLEAPSKVSPHNTLVETAPAFVHVPDEFDEPAPADPYASALAKMTALAEAELVVRAEGRAEHAAKVAELTARREEEGRPAPARVAPFDADFYRAQNSVAEGRALWLAHRHLHTNEPMPAPAKGLTTDQPPAEPRLVDDDGTPLETPREMDARHEAEHSAKVAELMEGNPFVPACCPDDEPAPCSSCLDGDAPDGAWDDSDRWAITPDAELPMAELVDLEAARYRAWGTDLGDLLAERTESLAAQMRALEATTPDGFRDRRDSLLAADMDRARARMSACC